MNELEKYLVKDAMQLSVGESVEKEIKLSAKFASELVGIILDNEVTINLNIEHIDTGVEVGSVTEFIINRTCSKCNKPTQIKCANEINQTYLQMPEETEEDVLPISRQLEIDITQQVIDTIVLAIPINILCNKSCKGLCSTCGANINDEENHYLKFPKHKVDVTLDNHPKIV